MPRILVVDDERDLRLSVAEVLRDHGLDVVECGTAKEAMDRLTAETFDAVLTDLRMPGASGLELLKLAAARMPDCILIVLTAYGSMESVIEALRLGAHDFLLKPVELEGLVRKVDLLLKHQATLAENRVLRGALERVIPSTGLVGRSRALLGVQALVARAGPTDSTILITGETGTGKELVARAIHQSGPRRDAPFVAINCGSIPEMLLESELFGHVRGAFTGAERDKRGLFEVAGAGTIFLDEIGEMPLSVQPKLLRALESREILRVGSTTPLKFAARIVAATHRDLAKRVAQAGFRADLYYRINVVEIAIPPLRDHAEDIQPIATHLVERLCGRMNRPVAVLEAEALRALEQYRWPGNVRELANVLERALILTDQARIGLEDLPGLLTAGPICTDDDLKRARQSFERGHMLRVIEKCDGDKRRAAEAMGIDLSSLYRKLEE